MPQRAEYSVRIGERELNQRRHSGAHPWLRPRWLTGNYSVYIPQFALVRGEGSENFLLLLLGHLDEVERSSELSRNLVELGRRIISGAV